MSRLALIDLADKSVIREVVAGGWIELPNGSRVSPATAGWEGGGTITYEKTGDGERAVEGPPRFAIVAIDAFDVPEGKRASGRATLAIDAKTGRAVEIVAVEDDTTETPEPPESRVAAMLTGYGLTLDELRTVLAGGGA